MRVSLIAVGNKMPDWIQNGYSQYFQRLPKEWRFELHELSPARRHKSSRSQDIRSQEAERILARISDQDYVIALDQRGESWTNEVLAEKLARWQQDGQDLVFLIGGADGLAHECLQRANARWSLSSLVFPHGLVRVMLVEQLYRSWSILSGHPYHGGH